MVEHLALFTISFMQWTDKHEFIQVADKFEHEKLTYWIKNFLI